tara:strand:- start:6772 stop:8019 length:1248 start_codon:yes stop_codon:yes gene_type:complete
MGTVLDWSSNYPTTIDTVASNFPTLADGVHDIRASHLNSVASAVVALESKVTGVVKGISGFDTASHELLSNDSSFFPNATFTLLLKLRSLGGNSHLSGWDPVSGLFSGIQTGFFVVNVDGTPNGFACSHEGTASSSYPKGSIYAGGAPTTQALDSLALVPRHNADDIFCVCINEADVATIGTVSPNGEVVVGVSDAAGGAVYTVTVVVPSGSAVPLSAAVVGVALTVTLAWDGSALVAADNTATKVAAAITALDSVFIAGFPNTGTGASALVASSGPTSLTKSAYLGVGFLGNMRWMVAKASASFTMASGVVTRFLAGSQGYVLHEVALMKALERRDLMLLGDACSRAGTLAKGNGMSLPVLGGVLTYDRLFTQAGLPAVSTMTSSNTWTCDAASGKTLAPVAGYNLDIDEWSVR